MPDGLSRALVGAALGISLAAPPGPVMAVMATASVRGRSRESILTGLGAMTGDALWLALALLGFMTLLRDRPRLVGALGLGGAVLLLWMAREAFRSARQSSPSSARTGSYRLGLLTVLTSPFSFAWWLANGGLLLSSLGSSGIGGMFLALFVYGVAFTYGLKWIGSRLQSAVVAVAYASVFLLSAFACWVAFQSVQLLRS